LIFPVLFHNLFFAALPSSYSCFENNASHRLLFQKFAIICSKSKARQNKYLKTASRTFSLTVENNHHDDDDDDDDDGGGGEKNRAEQKIKIKLLIA
jgi:hypothetical protein